MSPRQSNAGRAIAAMGAHHLERVTEGPYGWAVFAPGGAVLEVDGSLCIGVTRWEARQVLGFLGVAYTEGGEVYGPSLRAVTKEEN